VKAGLRLFESANEQCVTVVLITHDPEVAARAKRRIMLADGRVACRGSRFVLGVRAPGR